MAVVEKSRTEGILERAEQLFGHAGRHGLALKDYNAEIVAWCSGAGCFKLERFYDGASRSYSYYVGAATGDVEDAISKFEKKLAELDELYEEALRGGELAVFRYVRAKREAYARIERYSRLLMELHPGTPPARSGACERLAEALHELL